MRPTGQSNLASSMILEDHLKHVLNRTGPKPFKVADNKFLPKPQHSAFGDFPSSHMAKKQSPVLQPAPLAAAEQSAAATMMSKSPAKPLFLPLYPTINRKQALGACCIAGYSASHISWEYERDRQTYSPVVCL